ncbi:embigin [Pholidichthys leucotaenia]
MVMSASWKNQLFLQILLLLSCCRHSSTSPTTTPLHPITLGPTGNKSVILRGENHTEKVELSQPINLTLECTWMGNQKRLPNITGYWRKDGEEIQDSHLTVQFENEKYNLKREFSISTEKDLGIYSCVFGSEAHTDFILAAPQIGEMRDKPIVSYVGDSVGIICKMDKAKPKPHTWFWYRENGTDKDRILINPQPHRYEINNNDKEQMTKLVVHNLTQDDSGLYYCGAVYGIGSSMGHVELKVITIMEPLKPFLAILVEVIILVTAILVYEKTQPVKRETAGDVTNAIQKNDPPQEEDNKPEENSWRLRKF